jgi:RNHCP domain
LSRDQRNGAGRRGPDTFRCRNCRLDVPMRAPGTRHRNHCPNCLWSRHVDDDVPGDRAAECHGTMEPVSVCVRPGGEWALVHRCTGCGAMRLNRTAGDDNALALMRLAVRPLADPPFPLEWLTRL